MSHSNRPSYRARLAVLADMLTYRRPAGSDTERAFRLKYIETLPGNVTPDAFGNLHAYIGDGPYIMFSSHTDTVHRTSGRQSVHIAGGTIGLSKRAIRAGSNCLGADCTAGIFIMSEMMRAGVPGHYVFHHAEERGGIGSSNAAADAPELFAGDLACIAFDRRGTADVITHQMSGRTAGDRFAQSLADVLHAAGLPGYAPCDAGIFTDSASYTDLIGDCTNVSVGYQNEHTTRETQDVPHLFALADAMIGADLARLVFERKPGEIDPDDWGYWPSRWTGTRSVSTSTAPAQGTARRYDNLMSCTSECEHCTCLFDPYQSDAEDWPTFCSLDCERTHRSARVERWQGIFLSETYADVQATLHAKKDVH